MVASATAVSPQNLWLQLCGGLWMEQGLVPAVPACLWGSWGVTVAVTSLADLWDVGGIGSYSCLLWKRLSRCPFCRGGLFSRCLCWKHQSCYALTPWCFKLQSEWSLGWGLIFTPWIHWIHSSLDLFCCLLLSLSADGGAVVGCDAQCQYWSSFGLGSAVRVLPTLKLLCWCWNMRARPQMMGTGHLLKCGVCTPIVLSV